MDFIKIQFQKSTKEGEIFPYYDKEANLLEVSSKVKREWAYSVNIHGAIIIDIDSNRVIANFDLILPKRHWKTKKIYDIPNTFKKVNLLFTKEAIEHDTFEVPKIEVISNTEKSFAQIIFGPINESTKAYFLSKKCMVIVNNDDLVGFYVKDIEKKFYYDD